MARNKPKDQRQPPITRTRTTVNGVDSIFAGGRNPTHAELMEYARFCGAKGPPLVDMLGTGFLTNADAVAYWQYMERVRGAAAGSNTPDP